VPPEQHRRDVVDVVGAGAASLACPLVAEQDAGPQVPPRPHCDSECRCDPLTRTAVETRPKRGRGRRLGWRGGERALRVVACGVGGDEVVETVVRIGVPEG